MFLYELEEQLDFSPRLVAITNQLKQYFDKKGYPENFTVDDLLSYFAKYDIIIDTDDLYNMIQNPPLKDLISNIQGGKVVFVGQKDTKPDIDIPDKKTDDVVKKMAKRAMKRNS
jgi:galactitol-specific phosphotransferase system IIB component